MNLKTIKPFIMITNYFCHLTVNRKLKNLSENYDGVFRDLADAIWSSAQLSDKENVHINDKVKGKIVSIRKPTYYCIRVSL